MLSASNAAWMSNVSQLEVLITRACSPTMGEPNYALHLEVAEHINQKKANTYVAHPSCVPAQYGLSPALPPAARAKQQ